jgi:hypothetical protein
MSTVLVVVAQKMEVVFRNIPATTHKGANSNSRCTFAASIKRPGIDMSGHPIIAVGAASADSAAIRAALPGDSHHRRLINDLLCWIGRFTEDDGDLRR